MGPMGAARLGETALADAYLGADFLHDVPDRMVIDHDVLGDSPSPVS